VRSNSAILLVTCAIALAAPTAGAESNKPGEGPNLTAATDRDLERHAVREHSRVDGFATAAIRDDRDHVEDHRAGVRRYEMQP